MFVSFIQSVNSFISLLPNQYKCLFTICGGLDSLQKVNNHHRATLCCCFVVAVAQRCSCRCLADGFYERRNAAATVLKMVGVVDEPIQTNITFHAPTANISVCPRGLISADDKSALLAAVQTRQPSLPGSV